MKVIIKVKVTKQEIRTYYSDGSNQPWTYSDGWLKTILGNNDKYEISDKNANVTWYELKDTDKQEVAKETTSKSPSIVDILLSEDYIITDSVKDKLDDYSIDDLRTYAKNNKISGHTLKAIDKIKS